MPELLRIKRLVPVLTLLALLAAPGCGARRGAAASEAGSQPAPAPAPSAPAASSSSAAPAAAADFALEYDPDSSVNPYSGTSAHNADLFGLLYEGLFTYGNDFTAQGVLCESFDTADGVNYTIKLRSDAVFHDGTRLTASDAAYSINKARSSGRYASRLARIASAAAADETTLSVRLTSADRTLPLLLDVPIVKNGTAGDAAPIGSGPYELVSVSGQASLRAFSGYRDYGKLSMKKLTLIHANDENLAQAFAEGTIDLVSFDPTGSSPLKVHMEHETRYCETSDLVYLGFNTSKGPLADAVIRRGISRLVDKNAVCSLAFGTSARPAPLILSSALPCYDASWETDTGYSLQAFSELFASKEMKDYNSDGFLESPSGPFKLKVIVNRESAAKTAVAQKITQDLKARGLDAELSVLSWNDFSKALGAGEFSVYVAEAQLPPSFDPSAILASGGPIAYGGTGDAGAAQFISAYLSGGAGTDGAEGAAALCGYAKQESRIIPIAFKKTAVLTHVGAVSGMDPSQSGVFRGIADWKFGPG